MFTASTNGSIEVDLKITVKKCPIFVLREYVVHVVTLQTWGTLDYTYLERNPI